MSRPLVTFARFGGREATAGEIEAFVLVDTEFTIRETHYKLKVLRPSDRIRLEQATTREVPQMRGFSLRNLCNMRRLFESVRDSRVLRQLVAEVPWGHIPGVQT